MAPYHSPSDILDVLQKIEFEEALEPNDPRRVDTREARGSEQTFARFARKFGLLVEQRRFVPNAQKHLLFFGHVGAGKTTELKFYGAQLRKTKFILPVEINVATVLDVHNLQFADLLMAMAHELLKALAKEKIDLPASAASELEKWFDEKVATTLKSVEFTNEINAGAEIKTGIPFLTSIFAKCSAAFKGNVTYKEELRRVIRNTFADFAASFNCFIREAENALSASWEKAPVRILFIVDGTDKLREEDRRTLFVQDTALLLAVDTLAVYTAPIALKYEGGLVGQLDADLVLPMIKLEDAQGGRCEAGWRAMRKILLNRADRSLFAGDDEIEQIVAASGGHPRELLRLLQLCCEFFGDKIDAGVVTKAIAQLASEYRRQLEAEDYALLVKIDRDPLDTGNDERVQHLLYCLALLEYNDGSWRRSHPVIRTLEGYRRAEAAAQAAA